MGFHLLTDITGIHVSLFWHDCGSTILFIFQTLWFNLLATDFFFQILAHPIFKMWVIQKPNKVALWNKRHFEGGGKKWRLYSMFKILSMDICWINIKCGIYRVILRPSYARFLKVKIGIRERGCEVLRWMGWFCISRILRTSFFIGGSQLSNLYT